MTAYQYEAYQLSSRRQEIGLVEALNERGAREALREKDLITTELKPLITQKRRNSYSFLSKLTESIRPVLSTSRIMLLENLVLLLQSGLTFNEALIYLKTQPPFNQRHFSSLLEELHQKTLSGVPLSIALKEHASFNEPLIINLISVAEKSSNFTILISYLVACLKKRNEFNLKIKNIASSFLLISFLFIASGLFLLSGILDFIPQQELMTMVASVWSIINSYILFLLISFIFVFYGLFSFLASDLGKAFTHYYLLKLPILKQLIITLENVQWLNTLNALIQNKIPTLEALDIAFSGIGNAYVKIAYSTVLDRVKEGQRLSVALSKTKCLPDITVGMIASAEARGKLRPALKDVMQLLESDANRQFNEFQTIKQLLLILTTSLSIIVLFSN